MANSAPCAATVWLFNVPENPVTKVPQQAAVTTSTRPQSVVPSCSTRRVKSRRYSSNGSQLMVSRIVRLTKRRFSLMSRPSTLCSTQYSPASTVGSRVGLLE